MNNSYDFNYDFTSPISLKLWMWKIDRLLEFTLSY